MKKLMVAIFIAQVIFVSLMIGKNAVEQQTKIKAAKNEQLNLIR